jgi:hypothetical protein
MKNLLLISALLSFLALASCQHNMAQNDPQYPVIRELVNTSLDLALALTQTARSRSRAPDPRYNVTVNSPPLLPHSRAKGMNNRHFLIKAEPFG